MVWNDGSSLPSPNVTNATSPSAPLNNNGSHDDAPPLYNHEDFLLAQEVDIDESLAKTDTSGEAYLRPFSRVHLASKLNILAAPTVCIYHLDKQKMLDRNVRMARLHSHRRDETWGRWKRGETAKSLGITDALHESPIVVILLVFALVYWSFILIGGQDYNVCIRAVLRISSHFFPSFFEKPWRKWIRPKNNLHLANKSKNHLIALNFDPTSVFSLIHGGMQRIDCKYYYNTSHFGLKCHASCMCVSSSGWFAVMPLISSLLSSYLGSCSDAIPLFASCSSFSCAS